jgi:glucuronokinase
MQHLGGLADQARDALLGGDKARLASLMEENFAQRRLMYGDAVVGAKNIQVAELARGMGLAAKFTGSGGALVCMRKDGSGW